MNIYFQGKLVKVQQGGDRQATQTKEGGASQLKKMYKCRVDNCQHPPFTTKHAVANHLLIFQEKEGEVCQICGKNMSKYHMAGHMDNIVYQTGFSARRVFAKVYAPSHTNGNQPCVIIWQANTTKP